MDTAASRLLPCAISSPLPPLEPAKFPSLRGQSATPLILDVRREAKFAASDRIVCAAVRVQPEDIAAFARAHTPREVLVYCVYGHNVSEEAVHVLQAAGWSARALAGGIEGGKEPDDMAASALQMPPDWSTLGLAAQRRYAANLRVQLGAKIHTSMGVDTDTAADIARWRVQRLPTIQKRPDWGGDG
jgi:rhodanese-related sulfurtransferase